jgi:hypothetical protein
LIQVAARCGTNEKAGVIAGFLLEDVWEKKRGYSGVNPLAGKNDPWRLLSSLGVAPR